MLKLFFLCFNISCLMVFQTEKPTLKYIAFGDSYTICTGTTNLNQQWPTILTNHLNEANIKIELIANPARNGFTTQNVIDKELPLLKSTTLDFATLLIGVNDWVQQVDIKIYHKNLNFIIDNIQRNMTNKSHLILITIPDFSATPEGANYGSGRDIPHGIAEFNKIIKDEAKKRKLICVDIFALTQLMKNKPDLIAKDDLHPSAKEYALWEELLFKEASKLLN